MAHWQALSGGRIAVSGFAALTTVSFRTFYLLAIAKVDQWLIAHLVAQLFCQKEGEANTLASTPSASPLDNRTYRHRATPLHCPIRSDQK